MQLTRITESPAAGTPRSFSTPGANTKKCRTSLPWGLFAPLLLSAFVFYGLSGCALLQSPDDPTRFYVLTVQNAQPVRAVGGDYKRWKVGLKPVELPAYLRSKAIVVRTSTHELYFADYNRWAEPLDLGISRVLKETLSSARNVESVALNSHGDETLDYEVAIRILACEGVRVEKGNSSIRFAMTWESRRIGTNKTATQRGEFSADPLTWDGKDYGQLAEQISDAIAGASRTLASDLPMEAAIPIKATSESPKP